jgi:hypothetical protein
MMDSVCIIRLFETEMFRAYGTLGLVVEIPVRHMNVTAKDNLLISEPAYS